MSRVGKKRRQGPSAAAWPYTPALRFSDCQEPAFLLGLYSDVPGDGVGAGWGDCSGEIVQTSLSVGPVSFSAPESPLAVICSVYSLNHHV